MAIDASDNEPEKKERKERKKKDKKEKKDRKEEKQEKRAATDGVAKAESKAEKKSKSDQKTEQLEVVLQLAEAGGKGHDTASKLREVLNGDATGKGAEKKRKKKNKSAKEEGSDADADEMDVDVDPADRIIGDNDEAEEVELIHTAPLLKFAEPLAEDKILKKVLHRVKKASRHKTLKRGVKEVQKAIRKCGVYRQSASEPLPHAIVIMAGDIWPPDVISHLPVHCEDHNVPYFFVPSRAELGVASGTKRATSVVMVVRDKKEKKAEEGEKDKEGENDEEGKNSKEEREADRKEAYAELAQIAQKLGSTVKI